MIWEPIEKRYNPYSIRERQMFNSSAFAIAAGVVAVGSAAASAAVSMSAADRAAKAQDAASRRARQSEMEAFERQELAGKKLKKGLKKIKGPEWDLDADIADAARITGYNEEQLERLYPGARSQRELASAAISDYMKGIVPQDVQEQTMRMIAERGGAGFNIATAGQGMGVQGPQANLARSLGLTSLQLQQTGMGLSRDWQSMAGAFIQNPLQVGQLRFNYQQAATDLAMDKVKSIYAAESGLAGEQQQMGQRQYQRSIQQAETNMAAQQAIGSGIQSIGSATAGALMGVGGGYGQLAAGAAQSAGPVPTTQVTGYQGKTYIPQQTSTGAEYYALAPKAYQR